MNNSIKRFGVTLLVIGSLVGGASAAIVFQDLGGAPVKAQVSFSNLTFTATATHTTHIVVVFEDFFAENATSNGSGVSGSFNVSTNLASTVSFDHGLSTSGQYSETLGIIDPNDLILQIDLLSIYVIGDTIEIEGVDLVYSSATKILDRSNAQNFSVRLSDNAGNPLSDAIIAGVPEPSSTALLGLGGLALMLRRRR